jgi:hypothetical protein
VGRAVTTAATVCPDGPEAVWRVLAPLLSAPGRRSVRVYDEATGRFSRVGRLTRSMPTQPAATYLYTKAGRTHLLALDFDCARADRATVEADLATAAEWITRCGGVIVTDRSPGGAHLLCPLAIGTTAGVEEISHLVALMAARLPTLDKTPNTNPDTGCLSAPGSRTKDGRGHRQLGGPLSAAVEAFTTRSAPALLPRLYELLGAVAPRHQGPAAPPPEGTPAVEDYCTGTGDNQCLAPAWVREDPLHPDIAHYAQHGTLSPGQRQWDTPSEARMAVITAAVARGHSPASITALIAPGGPWQGLAASYTEHCQSPAAVHRALRRDFSKSLTWLCRTVLKHRYGQHKNKNSQGGLRGGGGPRGPLELRRWLAAALLWADAEYAGRRRRWTVRAVLQTLAWHAHIAGEEINGVWTVGVGGRHLSLASGALSHDVVYSVLREIRDLNGAPLLRSRCHVGLEADYYALTRPDRITASAAAAARMRIEPVHEAWSILGHHLRRIYELVADHGITTRAELYTAAGVTPGAGDDAVTALQIAGLLTRPARGAVAVGPVTLDAIAAAHNTEGQREDRIACYRAQRAQWRIWLKRNLAERAATAAQAIAAAAPAEDPDVERTFWTSAMIHAPPVADDSTMYPDRGHQEAVGVALAALGGRILVSA